ncbi:MAG: putative collagen-binding domain-containing protein [Fimbriiglobus sp.]
MPDRLGMERKAKAVPESLDGGKLGRERKLYLRELIARFGYLHALNWNLGEENTQSTEEVRDMAAFIAKTDPFPHPIVLHTFPPEQDAVYTPLLGKGSSLHGVSLQNSWSAAHQRTLKWIRESDKTGRAWVVCNDEQNPADLGVPPDEGYMGFDGKAVPKKGEDRAGVPYTRHDIRKHTLWGTLTAGGAGVEYYFGYRLAQNDLVCEDFRSREKTWQSGKHALGFFRDHRIPVAEMTNADELVGNPKNTNGTTCLAKPGEIYVISRTKPGEVKLDLFKQTGEFTVAWFDPRNGGKLAPGSVAKVPSGGIVNLGTPPNSADEDWVILVLRGKPQ